MDTKQGEALGVDTGREASRPQPEEATSKELSKHTLSKDVEPERIAPTQKSTHDGERLTGSKPPEVQSPRQVRSVDWWARGTGGIALVVSLLVGTYQARNALASEQANRRSAQAAVARVVEWSGAETSELWATVEAFADANADALRVVARTKRHDDPNEVETRAEAERLGHEVQRQLTESPAQLNACRRLVLELGLLGEEIAQNRDAIERLRADVQREVVRLNETRTLLACVLATNENETRVGYFVAAFFFTDGVCDARPWLRSDVLEPGLARVLAFASTALPKCAEPDVSIPVNAMSAAGCDGIITQAAAFAPDSTMKRGAVQAGYAPPGPVEGRNERLRCFQWTSAGGQHLIELGAVLNGGAYVRVVAPSLEPISIEIPASKLNRRSGEPLRFLVDWKFTGPPAEQRLSVLVNDVLVRRHRFPPRTP